MRKKLDYYLSLDYPVEIRKLSKNEGGGYLASIPQLGAKAFCADGEIIDEALANLGKVKKSLFQDYLEKGFPIPEPEAESTSIFSGKFVVRIPTELHRQLVERAHKQNISLNSYIVYLLAYNTGIEILEHKVEECFNRLEPTLKWIQFKYASEIEQDYFPMKVIFSEALAA